MERNFWRYWLTGLLLLALMIAINPWLCNPVAPWGIADHQSAATAMRVDAIQHAWLSDGVMNIARLAMAIDLVYIAVYSYGAYCGGRLFGKSDRPYLKRLGNIIAAAAMMLGIADYVETICQFVQAMTFAGSDLLAEIATTARPIKSVAFLFTFLGILTALAVCRFPNRNA